MLKLLQFSLFFLGSGAIVIGLAFIVAGPYNTASFFTSLFAPTLGTAPTPTAFNDPSVDSEFRFYAVFWLAYGVFTCTTVNRPLQIQTLFCAGLFFAAGAARLPGIAMLGEPHPLFILLMGIELTLPIAILVLWWFVRRKVG